MYFHTESANMLVILLSLLIHPHVISWVGGGGAWMQTWSYTADMLFQSWGLLVQCLPSTNGDYSSRTPNWQGIPSLCVFQPNTICTGLWDSLSGVLCLYCHAHAHACLSSPHVGMRAENERQAGRSSLSWSRETNDWRKTCNKVKLQGKITNKNCCDYICPYIMAPLKLFDVVLPYSPTKTTCSVFFWRSDLQF